MASCIECGNQLDDKAVVCTQCGVAIEERPDLNNQRFKKLGLKTGLVWVVVAICSTDLIVNIYGGFTGNLAYSLSTTFTMFFRMIIDGLTMFYCFKYLRI